MGNVEVKTRAADGAPLWSCDSSCPEHLAAMAVKSSTGPHVINYLKELYVYSPPFRYDIISPNAVF